MLHFKGFKQMKIYSQGCVDHYELQELRLDQLLVVHKITLR